MRIQYISIVCFLFFLTGANLYAIPEGSVDCRLDTLQTSYFPGEDVTVKFMIKNVSSQPVTLILSDKNFENFQLHVQTLQNQVVKPRESYLLMVKEAQLQNLGLGNKSSLLLNPGDEFGREILLTDIFSLETPNTYVISGTFFPVPQFSHSVKGIESSALKIKVREGQLVESHQLMLAELDQQVLESHKTPQETIEFMLSAKMNYNWENYFRYIDLEMLIKDFQEYYDKYLELPRSQRGYLLAKFQEYLKDYLKEDLIGWNIYRVIIEEDYAVVYAMLTYEFMDNYELRKVKFNRNYSFKLYKKNNQWFLYSYTVRATSH